MPGGLDRLEDVAWVPSIVGIMPRQELEVGGVVVPLVAILVVDDHAWLPGSREVVIPYDLVQFTPVLRGC
jgi:hypothetical protein